MFHSISRHLIQLLVMSLTACADLLETDNRIIAQSKLFKYLNLKTSGLCVKLPIQGCNTLKYSAWPIHTGTWEALIASCPPRCYSASWTAYFHVGPVLSSNKSFSRPGHPNQKPHQHRSYQRFAKFRLPFMEP
jgi:hypothetical protein